MNLFYLICPYQGNKLMQKYNPAVCTGHIKLKTL